jgi:chaperonin cofactor prefoldin
MTIEELQRENNHLRHKIERLEEQLRFQAEAFRRQHAGYEAQLEYFVKALSEVELLKPKIFVVDEQFKKML